MVSERGGYRQLLVADPGLDGPVLKAADFYSPVIKRLGMALFVWRLL